MSDDAHALSRRGEEVLQLFHRGAEFTRELLQENERLRSELARLSQVPGADPRLEALHAENLEFARRFVEIEQENNALANLYVASCQLHSTLVLDEVIRIVTEIAINLVGAEVFALYLVDDRDLGLSARAAEGWELTAFPRVPRGAGLIGRCVEGRSLHVGPERESRDPARPIVCVPLVVQEQGVGAIAIYRLLEQKQGMGDLDRELFAMLGGHAATALLAAKLYAQSERKLHTLQGFIELLAS